LSHILDMDARALVPRDDVIQAIGKGADLGLLDGVPLLRLSLRRHNLQPHNKPKPLLVNNNHQLLPSLSL
jgi:hypothetical protein